jgi:hypothetical protein
MKNIIKNKPLLLIIVIVAVIIIVIVLAMGLYKSKEAGKITGPTLATPEQQEIVTGTDAEKAVTKEAVKEPEKPAGLAPEEEKAVSE